MRLSTSRWVVALALGGGLDQCVLNGGYQYSFRVGILRGRRRGGLSLKQNDGQRHDERHGRNNAA